jgi:hypothetical protein
VISPRPPCCRHPAGGPLARGRADPEVEIMREDDLKGRPVLLQTCPPSAGAEEQRRASTQRAGRWSMSYKAGYRSCGCRRRELALPGDRTHVRTWCGQTCAREHLCAHPLHLLAAESSKNSLGRPNTAPPRTPPDRSSPHRTRGVRGPAGCACSGSSRATGTGTSVCARQSDRLPLASTQAPASASGVAELVRLAHR